MFNEITTWPQAVAIVAVAYVVGWWVTTLLKGVFGAYDKKDTP